MNTISTPTSDMTFWKIASRWDDVGHYDSSILDIFWKHGVAFIYPEGHDLTRISPSREGDAGDLIAIADGHQIVAIAKPLGEAATLEDLKVKLSRYDIKRLGAALNEMVGIRVRLHEIPSNLRFHYASRSRFCRIEKQEIIETVYRLWNLLADAECKSAFKIDASTITLSEILEHNEVKHYIVPVYQRSYSWGTAEVERLVNEIIASFRKGDEMFLGTIQLSQKYLLSPRGTYFQEVIDGQQRLITCALIMKVLADFDPNDSKVKGIANEFKWIETRVSNGQQQEQLDEALHTSINELPGDGFNRFVNNCIQIRNLLTSAAIGERIDEGSSEQIKGLNVRELASHLTSKLVFVAIETKAGLSRTIQIFNSINTAGMDLGCGDLFKIRAFEYLKDHAKQSSACFDEISRIYEDIDSGNRRYQREVTTVNEILEVYQRILVARSQLPDGLARLSTDRFYEGLFDTYLGVRRWNEFQHVRSLKPLIDIDEIRRLVEIRFRWTSSFEDPASQNFDCCSKVAFYSIWLSRYRNYWILTFILHFIRGHEEDFRDEHNAFIQALAKLFGVFSVIYGKQVNEVHSFVAKLTRSLVRPEEPVSIAEAKCSVEGLLKQQREAFLETLKGNFAAYPVAKNLICRILEVIENRVTTESIIGDIFGYGYDVEHIQSYQDSNVAQREQIQRDWGDTLHGLGNLVLLEANINRSIGNKLFVDKRSEYAKSRLLMPKKLSACEDWTLADANQKLARHIEALDKYYFG